MLGLEARGRCAKAIEIAASRQQRPEVRLRGLLGGIRTGGIQRDAARDDWHRWHPPAAIFAGPFAPAASNATAARGPQVETCGWNVKKSASAG
jgi:hypothetical protein